MMDGKVTFSRGCWICAAIILLFLILFCFCAGFRHFVLREHNKSEYQVELGDDAGSAVLRISHDRTLINLPAELGSIGGGNYEVQLDVYLDSGREFHLTPSLLPKAIWELEGETFLVLSVDCDVYKVISETEVQKLDINDIGPLGTTPWNLPEGPKPWNLCHEASWEFWNRRFEIRWCYLAMKNGVDEDEFPDDIRQEIPWQ
jgi:hypothetical protein